MQNNLIFFLDVDNTLLDNDSIKEEIRQSLIKVLGSGEANHFWDHHDSFREKRKLVDFPNIIREYCVEKHKETCEIKLSQIFQGIDFKKSVYPRVAEVIAHLKTIGKVVIFSEGDLIYQREKIWQSGIGNLSDEILLYEHKFDHLDELMDIYRNYRHIFIDDRIERLSAIKTFFSSSITVLVCQGHYAKKDHPKEHKEADFTLASISDLLSFSLHKFQQKLASI